MGEQEYGPAAVELATVPCEKQPAQSRIRLPNPPQATLEPERTLYVLSNLGRLGA